MEEQEEACCGNLHRAQNVALARALYAHDVTVAGMVVVQRVAQEYRLAQLDFR